MIAIAVQQMADRLSVDGTRLTAKDLARKRFARNGAILQVLGRRQDGRIRIADLLLRMRGDPPVGGRIEKTRQKGGLRRPGEDLVQISVLVGHARKALGFPVGVRIMGKRAEDAELVDANGRHRLRVLLLDLPLPEEHRRHGLPVLIKPRSTVQRRHAPSLRQHLGRVASPNARRHHDGNPCDRIRHLRHHPLTLSEE